MLLQEILREAEREFDKIWFQKPSDEDANGGKDIKSFLRQQIVKAWRGGVEEAQEMAIRNCSMRPRYNNCGAVIDSLLSESGD